LKLSHKDTTSQSLFQIKHQLFSLIFKLLGIKIACPKPTENQTLEEVMKLKNERIHEPTGTIELITTSPFFVLYDMLMVKLR
jgi:hypothetical protein